MDKIESYALLKRKVVALKSAAAFTFGFIFLRVFFGKTPDSTAEFFGLFVGELWLYVFWYYTIMFLTRHRNVLQS